MSLDIDNSESESLKKSIAFLNKNIREREKN